ncbi:MAG: sulfatase [Polyangiaceae bacterium]
MVARARWLVLCALPALGACKSPEAEARAHPTPATSPSHGSATSSSASAPPAAASSVPLPEAAAPGAREPLNVVLILVDSLRWDMPWNGYSRPVAPFLTRFEKESVSYVYGYSISSSTSKSVLPMLAGKYPSEMARGAYFFTYWYPQNLSLPEMLGNDYKPSLGIFSHAYFFPATGVTQGFAPAYTLPNTVLNNQSTENITSERLTDAAIRHLRSPTLADQRDGKRFFAYVHYMDPHSPYLHHEGRPEWGTQPRDYYDQEVHFADEHVGRLITWIRRQPFGKHTAIIVSADHGESFAEHGHLKHGYEVWEELVRVPWFFWLPGAQSRRIDTPRSHIDMCRTILDLMGKTAPDGVRGKSLVPELFGESPEERTVIVDLPRDNLQDRRRAYVQGRHKLIVAGDDKRFLLFDVVADPRERKNLADKDRETLRKMKRIHDAAQAEIPMAEVRGDLPQLRDAPEGRRY